LFFLDTCFSKMATSPGHAVRQSTSPFIFESHGTGVYNSLLLSWSVHTTRGHASGKGSWGMSTPLITKERGERVALWEQSIILGQTMAHFQRSREWRFKTKS
jgi:hypothetical protein